MLDNKAFEPACLQWIERPGLSKENFDIVRKEVKKDAFGNAVFYFVYNKAFAGPFVNDRAISEMLYNSEFAFQANHGDSLTIERDTQGKLGGRNTWAARLIEELRNKTDFAVTENSDPHYGLKY